MNKNKIQSKNIIYGLVFKGIGVGLNFLLVPLLISYFGKTEYGLWITVFSVVNWIFLLDIGIGTGLRNKLTEAISKNEIRQSNVLISTSYLLILVFALFIFVIASIGIYYLDIQNILNYLGKSERYLKIFLIISLGFTVINFVLSLYKKLFLAIHKAYFNEFINALFITSYILCVFLWITFDFKKSLILLMSLFGILNVIFSIIATRIFFKQKIDLRVRFRFFNKNNIKPLFKLGGGFFIINMCLLIILFTDNIIISKLLGPKYVTDYSVIQRVFQFLVLVFNVILASSWSLYSKAIVDKDYKWIRLNFKKMNLLLAFLLFIGILIFIFLNNILSIWLGRGVIDIPYALPLANLLYFFMFSFANIYMFFINATGKIKVQMYLYIFGAILNIPLSIYFVRLIGNSTGVMISTLICILPLVIMMPFQTKKILHNFEKEII